MRVEGMRGCKKDLLVVMLHNIIIYHHISKNARDTHVRGGHAVWYKREKEKGKEKDIPFVVLHNIVMYYSILTDARDERWGAGVETQKNVLRVFGGWGRVPFNEPYVPSLSTIYDGA